jgi:glucose/arabinose dehydrogenase
MTARFDYSRGLRFATAFSIVCAIAGLSACGGGGSEESTSTAASASADAASAQAQLRGSTTPVALENALAAATSALVSPPIMLPSLSAQGTLLWPVPVGTATVSLEIRPFATLPLTVSNTVPRLNVLAHVNNRLFVAEEKFGKVYEITNGSVSEWFDVAAAIEASTDRKLSSLSSNAHSGLRSIAFHPDFNSNGRFYTSHMEERPANPALHRYLSDVASPVGADSVVAEWRVNRSTGKPQLTSYRQVLRVGIPVYDHPIKQIMFRPGALRTDADYGLLYIAHGDGSVLSVSAGDVRDNEARGKILRINPLKTRSGPYSVPTSNPFINSPTVLKEAYSIGHRNPHHLAFAKDGTLIAAEDGRDNIDEVNIIVPGANYGWPSREGSLVHLSAGGGLYNGVAALPANDQINGFTYPAMQFLHQGVRGAGFTGQALGGGYVVENGTALSGYYFSTDFVFSGDIFATHLSSLKAAITTGPASSLRMSPIARAPILFDHDNNRATPAISLVNLKAMMTSTLSPFYDNSGRVDMRFGQGPSGEMYLLSKRDRRVYLVTNSKP